MAVLASFSVEADHWYNDDEAKEVLKGAQDGIKKAIQQNKLEVEWLVMGFPFGIGSHYLMEVLFNGPPELLEGVPQGKPGVIGDPVLHDWKAGKVAAESRFRSRDYIIQI
ncbi:uncharacterized protein ACHE_10979A [Aspergillus chevalieri]|uniref:Uncharacterized protein n=1 Tax=Aspergillus chevalieri TaxID=182096 RepID=A0A7R7VEZ6_ASPCH|nr:uncharacterized protein ACHE_10979A [Aspergillus chevalieri]BCR83577.1 hypothetical protein ACHE_10979A [Aspergillus chevalieri]